MIKGMIDVTNDKTSFDYDIYKKLFNFWIISDKKEIFIKKAQFFTNLNISGCCEVKINGVWYAARREQILRGLKEYNKIKRKE